MANWECAIDGCGERFESVDRAIDHQASVHDDHECRICGDPVPDGYPAIDHVFEEHTRAEYVRTYGADADAIKEREAIKAEIDARIDGTVAEGSDG